MVAAIPPITGLATAEITIKTQMEENNLIMINTTSL
jgi:hypothetical protein